MDWESVRHSFQSVHKHVSELCEAWYDSQTLHTPQIEAPRRRFDPERLMAKQEQSYLSALCIVWVRVRLLVVVVG